TCGDFYLPTYPFRPIYSLNMDLKIMSVNCHPNDILVTFQGKYLSDSELDYHILQNEIQLAPKAKAVAVIGEFCLVQDKPFGTWNRGKILDTYNDLIEVLMIDQGNVVKVKSSYIVSVSGEMFTLPPKVVNGIFSNMLPTGEKWTPKAVNYFSSLTGLQIKGHVQTLLPNQVVLLEIPKVIDHALELHLAKYVDSGSFCFLVELIHKFPVSCNWTPMPDLLQQKKIHSDFSLCLKNNPPSFQKILDHLKPIFSVGTKEKVRISAVVSPEKFYCRFLSLEEDLNNLTSAMTTHYEAIDPEQNSMSDDFSVLCAAKRKDHLWHRGVIHKLISGEEMRVWFMDIGSYETVPSVHVQKLQPEYRSLSMMTIPCSLHATCDQSESNRNMQLLQIKQGLLGHIVIAHISQFCSTEQLYYVTLFEKDYELSLEHPLSNPPFPTASAITYVDINNAATTKSEKETGTSLIIAVSETKKDLVKTITYKTIQMEVDSVYVVFVEYVITPSNFWIKTDDCQNEFLAMMEGITKLYDSCGPTEMVLEDPTPGQICSALYAKDQHYYRAVVTELEDSKVVVYFLDFGNTETVDRQNVKTLLPQFTNLPALAMCCTLAYTYPMEDVWVMSANDYFKEIVSGKPLFCHVLAKKKYQYVVDICNSESSEKSNISELMVQAGFAEYWKTDLHPSVLTVQSRSRKKTLKVKTFSRQKSYIYIENNRSKKIPEMTNGATEIRQLEKSDLSENWEEALSNVQPISYKQYIFKPGATVDVMVSHVNTPADFWCQQLARSSELNELMTGLRKYYSACKSLYQQGQVACVVRRPCNGDFYRVSVINYASKEEVDVLFVDYGFQERVSVSQLLEIKAQFLDLEGQAFRCSVSNAITPARPNNSWTSGACKDFRSFVQVGSGGLNCTIHALFSNDSVGLYNAVKLETTFNNVCQYLVDKGHAVFSRDAIQSFNMHTFCYSDFDIKIGQEEQVYVTYIYSSGLFYCQLARNTSVIEALMTNVSKIGEQAKPVSGKGRKTSLCVVKYFEDGNYYRAMTHPVDDSSCFGAFFVDFGNNQIITEHEVLSVPKDAVDILSVPMQAIQCSFSGLNVKTITPVVKKWFTDHYIGKLLDAVVISKNNKGLLELELYDGSILLNQRILGECLDSESPVKHNKPSENGNAKTSIVKGIPCEDWSAKPRENACLPAVENITSPKRGDALVPKVLRLGKDSKMSCHVQKSKPKSLGSASFATTKETPKQTLVNCSDLPQRNIEPGVTDLGYISHINSPSDFYIQLAEHENKIFCLAEDLNKETSFQEVARECLTTGNLVVARYPEDLAFYRAVIKEVRENHVFDVEFIDYGNTAVVDSSNIHKLPDNFLVTPRLSIHATLHGLDELHTDCERNDEVAYNSQWKVDLTDDGKLVANELMKTVRTTSCQTSSVTKETSKISKQNQNIVESPQATNDKKAQSVVSTILHSHQIPSQGFQPNQTEKVKNVHIPGSGIFFVTLDRNSQPTLTTLISASVQKANNRLDLKNIIVGTVCLVKSVKMQKWLRAVVEKVFQLKKVMLVFFMDHGASETISMHNTKVLVGDIPSIPRQAVACKWVSDKNVDSASFLEELLSRKEMTIQVLFLELMSDNVWKVEFLINGSLLMEHLDNCLDSKKTKLERRCSSSEFAPYPCSKSSIPTPQLEFVRLYYGFVSTVRDPSDFCVQLDDSLEALNNLSRLMEGLPDQILSMPPSLLCRGSACLIKCFAEEEWCRAEIINVADGTILLDLIDNGVFKQIYHSDRGKLKMIPNEIACLPPLMHRCTLHGVIPRDGAHWSKEANAFFLDIVQKQNTVIQFIKRCPNNTLEVCVYGEGHGRLAYQLVFKGLARRVEGKDDAVTYSGCTWPVQD
uniref:Tudor domain containing 15 n=1 Tax=Leptobrachium leishanense TaxID=445787 RepID=A0A8C5MR12_9ANUR